MGWAAPQTKGPGAIHSTQNDASLTYPDIPKIVLLIPWAYLSPIKSTQLRLTMTDVKVNLLNTVQFPMLPQTGTNISP